MVAYMGFPAQHRAKLCCNPLEQRRDQATQRGRPRYGCRPPHRRAITAPQNAYQAQLALSAAAANRLAATTETVIAQFVHSVSGVFLMQSSKSQELAANIARPSLRAHHQGHGGIASSQPARSAPHHRVDPSHQYEDWGPSWSINSKENPRKSHSAVK